MRKLDENTFEPYSLSNNAEKEMWKDCIFVFDTSALLNFYEYSDATKARLFETIFSKIHERLWIPSHVEYEYLKNRELSIQKPIERRYAPLLSENVATIKKSLLNIENTLKDFQNRAKITPENSHPYITESISNAFKEKFHEFEQAFTQFENQVRQEIDERKDEIESAIQEDILLGAIKEFFSVGEQYRFSSIMEIIAEGEFRYKNEIPPGYKDFHDKKKKGIQKYGDLIIWKQILDHAASIKKPVILITDDLKEDWCYFQIKSNEKRIKMPQEDLIREFQDRVGMRFWMYTLKQFLYNSKAFLNTETAPEVFEEIDKVEQEQVGSWKDVLGLDAFNQFKEANERVQELADLGAFEQFKVADNHIKELAKSGALEQFKVADNHIKELAKSGALEQLEEMGKYMKELAKSGALEQFKVADNHIKELAKSGALEQLEEMGKYMKELAKSGALEQLKEMGKYMK